MRTVRISAVAALCGLAVACNQEAAGGAPPSRSKAATATAPASTTVGGAETSPTASAAPATSDAPASGSVSAATSSSAPAPETAPEGMALIPEGIFLMGSTHGRGNEEEWPAHEGIVPAYYMDVNETTMEAYGKCVTAGACKPPGTSQRFCNALGPDRFAADQGPRDKHPVNCISLYDAMAYCKHMGKRVPTEREWEYAARGGSEQRTFSWGEEPPTEKNSCYHHPGGSCPVGSFEPGAFGLYDMSGNSWEWVQSTFTPYPTRIEPDEPDPSQPKQLFVYRGGSWSRRFAKWLRNAIRNRVEPDKFHASLTVRCVKTIEPRRCPPETAPKGSGCERISGSPICEPGYAWKETKCVPSKDAPWIAGKPAGSGEATWGSGPATGDNPTSLEGGAVTRSRTAQFDADCQKNWPEYPYSYLFNGGGNYHDRKPVLSANGCRPRDMGTKWTSACCRQ